MTFGSLQIDTARLLLRPLVDADAAALFGIFSDARVMRYWSTPPWQSVADAHAMMARERAGMEAGDGVRLGIERRDDAALLGTVSLFALARQCRRAEIGYALHPDAWGRAYMDEALRGLLRHAFTTLALNRVEADIDPRNTASARSLERLGFQREGVLRERWIVGDEVSDSALYGLLQRDWHWRQ